MALVIRGNARNLPLADNSVDLIVTSPPYFALRSYQDGGEHYAGQIGDEPTPAEFVDSLIEVTRECVRVLKPSGSLWVNLGDKYQATSFAPQKRGKDTPGVERPTVTRSCERCGKDFTGGPGRRFCSAFCGGSDNSPKSRRGGIREKSLIGIPWRYALRCIDDLGLILRAEVIWSKPNGLPESVTDRVRRSHEVWFHFVQVPRYFSAVDEIREPHIYPDDTRHLRGGRRSVNPDGSNAGGNTSNGNPLGKLPGSVWTVPTEPLRVPDHLGVDHFAAFPTTWPKRIIQGWSPAGVCVECGDGRRPVISTTVLAPPKPNAMHEAQFRRVGQEPRGTQSATNGVPASQIDRHVTGYTCACLAPTADTTPAVVLDVFGGTGTTALVAKALGRHGISVDMSADYCRLATWRTNDRDQLAKVLGVAKAEQEPDNTPTLFDLDGGD